MEKYMKKVEQFSKFASLICSSLLALMLFVSCTSIDYSIETNINTSQDIYDITVEIKNNQDTIFPLEFLASSYEYISEEDDITSSVFKDYIGMYGYDMVAYLNNIPSIQETKQMILVLNDTATCSGLKIYDSSATLVDTWYSWMENTNLDVGQYYIVLTIHNEINEYYLNAEYLFVLFVN